MGIMEKNMEATIEGLELTLSKLYQNQCGGLSDACNQQESYFRKMWGLRA